MPIPILATKLIVPPPRPGAVSRPRLVARLDAGLDRRLTLVSAPAGTGKTTLLSEWLAHLPEAQPLGAGPRLAWISLDAGDSDLARFLAYLVAALPAARGLAGLLNAPQAPVAESFLTLLINDLAARGDRTVLVLDDYHAISAPAVHDALAFLLEHKPASLHVVLAGRIDPPLPLAQWRARGEISELRAADLRFSTPEAGEFLRRLIGAEVTPAQVAGLNSRIEGWAAGLQLAGISGRGRGPEALDRFIAEFSGRQHFIFDYLADEVLGRQPPDVQAFLLTTAVPERLCASLADALLAPDQAAEPGLQPRPSQALLEELEHRNLFLAPLDDSQHWYRYHGLFRDLLLARLAERGPEQVAELHRRAAHWFAENGLRIEAVEHGLAAGDHDFVVALIEQAYRGPAGWTEINYATLLHWLAALPPQVVQARWLLRLLATRMMYVHGDTHAATEQLDTLEQELRAAPDTPEVRQVLALIPADRISYALLRGELRTAIAFGRAMLDMLPAADHVGRARAAAVVGMAELRAGDVIGADASFAVAAEEAQRSIVPSVAVPFMCSQAEARLLQGRLHAAHELSREALELGRHAGRPLPVAGFALVGLAKALYEWNDLPAAQDQAEAGIALLAEGGITEAFGNGHGVLALIRQAAGDSQGAERAAEMAVHLARASGLARTISEAGAYRVRVWLSQGRVDRAAGWPDELARLRAGETLQEFEDLTVARLLLAQGEAAAALALLDRLAAAATAAGRHGRALEAAVLRSLAFDAAGRGRAALDALAAALREAEREGYVRTFVDAGPALPALLSRLITNGDAGPYARRLLAAVAAPSAAPAAAPVELPSGREREVLRLLATELSVPEIAGELGVAPSTVRSHVKHLYEMLGAHSRLEAVLRARELGWL